MGANPLPPLDKGFFGRLQSSRPDEFRPISNYMQRRYRIDVTDTREDGLEAVMSVIYTDVLNTRLASQAAAAFRALIRAVNAELSSSTNRMPASTDSDVYRILTKELAHGVPLDDIAIVTFNYDLQIEKSLEALETNGDTTTDGVALNFPYCYGLPEPKMTSPNRSTDLFRVGTESLRGVPLLKLHGSLNWYSTHNSRNPSVDALLRTSRAIRITRRREPNIGMTLNGTRKTYAFPVVIPPVLNKSAILPTGFGQVWTSAENHLEKSEKVIVFGYSCPPFDFEAANLIARTLRASSSLQSISVIDPNPDTVTRYANLCRARRIMYFDSSESYLS